MNHNAISNRVVTLFRLVLVFILVQNGSQAFAQFTLEEALKTARQSSPLIDLIEYSETENELQRSNIALRYVPGLNIFGQATYQSEVTSLGIELPGVNTPELSKDQYKVQGEISQLIYDGGAGRYGKSLSEANRGMGIANAELELEQLRIQIINTYFSILELDAHASIVSLKKENLAASIKKMEAIVENGAALKSELYALQAAAIRIGQQENEIKFNRKAALESLEKLTRVSLSEDEKLALPPETDVLTNPNPGSFMYSLFTHQQEALNSNYKLKKAAAMPRANVFIQGGYGRPGLNFLRNEFEPYYIAGARATWNISALYTGGNDKKIRDLGIEKVERRKDAYDDQLATRISAYLNQLENYRAMEDSDAQMVELYRQIRQTAEVQLENGVINSSDFLIRLNEENQSIIDQETHRIGLIKTEYILNHISGNYQIP